MRDLFWELDQHLPRPNAFVGIQQDSVEVVSFAGYHNLRIQIGPSMYDVHLSWRKEQPPTIRRVEENAG